MIKVHTLKENALSLNSQITIIETQVKIQTHSSNLDLKVELNNLIDLDSKLLLEVASYQKLEIKTPKIKKIEVISKLPSIYNAKHTPIKLYLPLIAESKVEITDYIMQHINKKYPLLKKANILPLRYYKNLIKEKIIELKFIDKQLYAHFKIQNNLKKNSPKFNLLYFLDTISKKSLTIDIPLAKS